MELYRWLRYAIPGGLFEIVLLGWAYADARFYDDLEWLPVVGSTEVALLTGATLVIGFVASVVMHILKWPRILRRFVARMDDGEILRISGSPLWEPGMSVEFERGYMDAVLCTTFAEKDAVLNRARGLLDLANGTSTAMIAVATATISVLAVGLVEHNCGNFIFTGLWALSWGIFVVLLWISQHHITNITCRFLIGAFSQQNSMIPDPD